MFIHKHKHDVARIHRPDNRAARQFSFVRERYNCIKYKNSPYYKGALLWDGLSVTARNSVNLLEFKKHLKTVYRTYDNRIS